jgi:Egg-laying hormone precursor
MRCCGSTIAFIFLALSSTVVWSFSSSTVVSNSITSHCSKSSRLHQVASDFERPATFLDSNEDGDDDEINVVFLNEDDHSEEDDDDAVDNQKGKELQNQRWGKLKTKFQQRLEEKRNRRKPKSETPEPSKQKESPKDKKRRKFVVAAPRLRLFCV